MKNQQPPKGRIKGQNPRILNVHSIFDTVQGEGPFSGYPATFVRLADCNLQCPLCDTDYTGGAGEMHIDSIAELCREELVVITGGEPFRQRIGLFCSLLINRYDKRVQIETNGTLPPDDRYIALTKQKPAQLFTVVSPKLATVRQEIERIATAYKYVVVAGEVALDGLPTTVLNHPLASGKFVARPKKRFKGEIFVHPADQEDTLANRQNMRAAIMSVTCDKASGTRRLGLQIHKNYGLA